MLPKLFCSFILFTSLLSCAFGQYSRVLLPPNYYAFTFNEDERGRVWIGMSDGNYEGALGVYSDGDLMLVSGSDSIPNGSYHTSLKLSDGSLMFGGSIISKKMRSLLVWVSSYGVDTIQIPIALSDPFINSMKLVNRNEIWIGTGSGLLINRRGQWDHFSTREGLPNNFVNDIIQDIRRMVWIGTETGVSYFLNDELMQVNPRSRLINTVTTFYSDSRGYLWAGARFLSEGISVYNGEIWETFTSRNGLVDNSTAVFFQDNMGNLWAGSCYHRSRGGVSVLEGSEWKAYSVSNELSKACVDVITEDSDGRVWLGGSLSTSRAKGITVFDGEKWHKIGASPSFPPDRIIAFFLDSGGRLWVSSFEGLYIIDKGVNLSQLK